MWRYAHYALQNHNLSPKDFMALPMDEKVFYIASDSIAAENMKVK